MKLRARLCGDRGRAAGAAGARTVARRRMTPRCGQLRMRWWLLRSLGRCRAAATVSGGALVRRKAVRWVLRRTDWGVDGLMAGCWQVWQAHRGRGWYRRCVDALGRCAERLSGAMGRRRKGSQELGAPRIVASRAGRGGNWQGRLLRGAGWRAARVCCAVSAEGERLERRRRGWLGWLQACSSRSACSAAGATLAADAQLRWLGNGGAGGWRAVAGARPRRCSRFS
jgi:hypothetical protein